MQYDLIVIGAGPGGYTGAIRAAKLGLKTAIIECRNVGGTCLNLGCIPTKALLFSSNLYHSRLNWESYGISATDISIDENKIYQRKGRIVSTLRDGVENLLKANGVQLIKGKGYIKDKNTVLVSDIHTTFTDNEDNLSKNSTSKELSSKYILLATGSVPSGFDPNRPILGLQDVLNSDDVLKNPVSGDSVVIVGGGVIAVEFACYFAGIGKSVTMLVSADRILRNLSQDISRQLSMNLKKMGIKILLNVKIKQLYKNKAEFVCMDKEEAINGVVIAALGRTSNLSDLGLENAGLKHDKFIKVDKNMQTEVDNIFACGDITGGHQLAHYAAASAITAVESMLKMQHSIDLSVCPSCIYTQPEIAVVGRTSLLDDDKASKFMMGANGRSMIEDSQKGYVKIVVDKNNTIVGGELFCANATEMISQISVAVQKKMSVDMAAQVIMPHPTVAESILESFEGIFGLATHMLPVFSK